MRYAGLAAARVVDGHVLSHLARNADAFAGRSRGTAARAAADVSQRAVPGRRHRGGSGRPAGALAADVRTPRSGWTRCGWRCGRRLGRPDPVRQRLSPAADAVTGRWREVEIHRVDLNLGYGRQEWAGRVLPGRARRPLRGRAGPPAAPGTSLVLHAADAAGQWVAGERDAPEVAVHGPAWALACWLVGRPGPAVGALKTEGGQLPAAGRLAVSGPDRPPYRLMCGIRYRREIRGGQAESGGRRPVGVPGPGVIYLACGRTRGAASRR